MSAATAQQSVDHGAAFPGFRMPDEQKVLFSESTGPNRILDQVLVDLQTPVGDEPRQRFPAFLRVINRLAARIFRNGRTTNTLIWTACGLLSTLDAMIAPCSVNTHGSLRRLR